MNTKFNGSLKLDFEESDDRGDDHEESDEQADREADAARWLSNGMNRIDLLREWRLSGFHDFAFFSSFFSFFLTRI